MKQIEHGMSLIVKTITRLTVGLILIYGIYITARGHLSPGGGATGGVIISLSLIHLMLAFGKEDALKQLDQVKSVFLAGVGGLFFLVVCAQNLGIFGEGANPFGDMAVAAMMGLGLFAIFVGLLNLTQNRT